MFWLLYEKGKEAEALIGHKHVSDKTLISLEAMIFASVLHRIMLGSS